MRILSTEYVTMYNILFDGTEYLRQVLTNKDGKNEPPIWFYNNDGMLDIVDNPKRVEELEEEFNKNIH